MLVTSNDSSASSFRTSVKDSRDLSLERLRKGWKMSSVKYYIISLQREREILNFTRECHSFRVESLESTLFDPENRTNKW